MSKAHIAHGKNTPMRCARHCKKRGFPFSGVQAGSHCFCGKKIAERGKRIRRTRCNSICPGNRNKWCGGSWAMNIYQNNGNKFQACPRPPQKGCRRHLGCYKDDPKRILPKAYVSLGKNSPALCAKHCRFEGYPLSGVQAGRQCFCGKSLPPRAKTIAKTRCNHQCPGNNKKWCGGGWAMNVYRRINKGKCKLSFLIFNPLKSFQESKVICFDM